MPWPAALIAGLAVLGGVGVLWDRHHQGKNDPKGIGVRVIQFFARL